MVRENEEGVMNRKPRVLLTANYGPNELGWGEDMFDLMQSRLARFIRGAG